MKEQFQDKFWHGEGGEWEFPRSPVWICFVSPHKSLSHLVFSFPCCWSKDGLEKYHLPSSTYSLGDKKWRLREVGCSGEFNKTRDFRGFPSWWPPIQRVEELKAKHPALQTSSEKPEMKKNPKMQTRGKQREELKETKRNDLRQLF